MSFDRNLSIGSSTLNGNTAVFFMILEISSAFIVLNIVSFKQNQSFINRTKTIIPINNSIFIYGLIIGLFLYIYLSGYLSMINFIWDLKEYIQKYIIEQDELNDSGFAGILFTPFKVIVALFLVSRVHSSKVSVQKKKYFYLLIIILVSIFIVGVSRLSMLQFTLPLIILISLILDQKDSRKLIIISTTVLVPIVLVATISKFTKGNQTISSKEILSASSLNAYFAGPGSIAVGFDAYEELSVNNNFYFLINDMFQNAPLLSNFTLAEYKTNKIFNEKIYGDMLSYDQIVPLSTSGLFHFGVFGSFFYAAFFLLIALYMERKSHKEIFLGYKYVFISLSITLSMVFMLNIGSFYFSLITGFLFIYAPFYFINKLQS
jgi:hypothetical protein